MTVCGLIPSAFLQWPNPKTACSTSVSLSLSHKLDLDLWEAKFVDAVARVAKFVNGNCAKGPLGDTLFQTWEHETKRECAK